jgi:hypothetical protein
MHAAYHEAAHAVVGCVVSEVLKERLAEVFITDEKGPQDSAGTWRGYAFFPPTDINADEPTDVAFAYAVQVASGQKAEERAGGTPDLCAIAGDLQTFHDWAHKAAANGEDVGAVMKRARAEAQRLVDKHWALIQEVAEELVDTPYEVHSLLAPNWQWGSGKTHYLSGAGVRDILGGEDYQNGQPV